MTTYEVRKNDENHYYPFTVYLDGKPTGNFEDQRGAQSWIDTNQAGSAYDLDLFNDFFSPTGTDTIIQPGSEEEKVYSSQKAAREATRAAFAQTEMLPSRVPEVEKKVIFLDGPYEVGAIITDKSNSYRVTQESYWLSEKDVADLEDGWDVSEEAGWHTYAELIEETNGKKE